MSLISSLFSSFKDKTIDEFVGITKKMASSNANLSNISKNEFQSKTLKYLARTYSQDLKMTDKQWEHFDKAFGG